MEFSHFFLYYLIAFAIQVLLFLYLRKASIRTPFLYSLFGALFVSGLIQMSMFLMPESQQISHEIGMRLFYAVTFIVFACVISYAFAACEIEIGDFTSRVELAIWLVAFCGAILSLVSDEIISGAKPLSFSVTAIRGKSYWLFQLHVFFILIVTMALVALAFIKAESSVGRKRSMFVLIAYAPFAICTAILMIALRYGSEINMPMIFPFFSTMTIVVIVYGEYVHSVKLNDSDKKISVYTQEHISSANDKLITIFNNYKLGEVSFTQASEQIDYLLLSYMYDKHNGNMMRTAQAMGLGRSTLYKKVQKHKLK